MFFDQKRYDVLCLISNRFLSFHPSEDVEGLTFVKSGSWDSIHVIEVLPSGDGSEATYKLTTTIMLSMKVANQSIGDANLSGSLTRQASS